MNHRAPYFTLQQLEALRVLLRMQWVSSANGEIFKTIEAKQVSGEKVSTSELVTQFVLVTDRFAPMLAALEVWAFQLKVSTENAVQVIMSEPLHKGFTLIATADYAPMLEGQLQPHTQSLIKALLEIQPTIVKALQDAATIDPEALSKGAKILPSGKPSSMMN